MVQVWPRSRAVFALGAHLWFLSPQMLLEYTRFEREAVRERAMGRIAVLTNLLSNYSTLKPSVNFGRDSSGPVRPEDISFPAMGRLVGRLILFRYSGEQTSYTAFHALFSLAEFLYKSRPRDGSDVFSWEAVTTSSLCYLSIIDCTQAFGRYLHSSERTDVVLEAIEAMKDPSILNKDVPCSILDVVMEDTDFWVTDVPKTVKCIFENLLYTTTEAGCVKVESLFLLMTTQYPSAVVISLCEMALQGDRYWP
nr:uncharacterized protein LOC113460190 [Zonotrichia albicollis]